ncbi:MAG: glycosyltransferase family 4 protein [Gemmatimonadales bacterium]
MKILYWTERVTPYIGGVELITDDFLVALAARGHDVTVIARKGHLNVDGPTVPGTNVPVHYFPFQEALMNKRFDEIISITRRIGEIKTQLKPDLIHLNFWGPSSIFHLRTLGAHEAPTLMTLYALPESEPSKTGVVERLFAAADWVVGPSRAVIDRTREWFPQITAKSSVIYNTLNLPEVEARPLPFDRPHLLCIGRVVPEKGFDLVVDALASILRAVPEIQLTIAGDGIDRPMLEQQARRLNVDHRIVVAGWVPPKEVLGLINTATIVIVPSRWFEPAPLVAIQAAHMGRPVVGTRTGGIPELVEDRVTGLVVDKEDPEAIARAVLYLLQNQDEARAMGERAKLRARSVFGWQPCVDAYDALYTELVGQHRARKHAGTG